MLFLNSTLYDRISDNQNQRLLQSLLPKPKGRRKTDKAPVHALTKAIRGYLALKGFFTWKGGCGGGYNRSGGWFAIGEAGAPDLFAIGWRTIHGDDHVLKVPVILGVEVKAGQDRVSDAQKQFHEAARAHGMTIIIAHKCEDVEKVVESL